MNMRAFTFALGTIAVLLDRAQSHYVFNRLSVGTVEAGEYEYVRKNVNSNHPITDFDTIDLRCNKGSVDSNETKTVEVLAGGVVTWKTDMKVYHPGPLSTFMTKVEDASTADGSTEWFKILDVGPAFNRRGGDWGATLQQEFPVQVPKCLAAGEYLMRIQQTAVHVVGGPPQFHVSCAQLRVTGGGKDLPKQEYLVKIPGAFKKQDPGYQVNIFMNFKEYEVPGPPVWGC